MPVFAGEFEGGALMVGVVGDVDVGGHGHVAVGGFGQARAKWRRRTVVRDVVFEVGGKVGRGWRGVVQGVLLDGEAVVEGAVQARFVDVVVVFFEVVGHAGEEDVRRVRAADDEARRVAGAQADGVGVAAREQVFGFGGDVFGAFAEVVGVRQVGPQCVDGGGLGVFDEGFGAFAFGPVMGVQAVFLVFEQVAGLAVEVVDEAGAPVVPEVAVGGADVGDGEQVEVVEVVALREAGGVFGDGGRVGEVFFLRGVAVVEVVFDEVDEEVAFGRADGVVFAGVEVGYLGADVAVVAVVAFADVVEEGAGCRRLRGRRGRGGRVGRGC